MFIPMKSLTLLKLMHNLNQWKSWFKALELMTQVGVHDFSENSMQTMASSCHFHQSAARIRWNLLRSNYK
jgi:hypothetical protein